MRASRVVAVGALALAVAGGGVTPAGAQTGRTAPRPPAPTLGVGPGEAGGAAGVGLNLRIVPDTVVVGMPFHLVVRVRAPRGSVVTFPVGPDSGTQVEALDPRLIHSRPDSTATDLTATYRLAAWDLGRLPLAIGDVIVDARGLRRTIPLGPLTVMVMPTVPAQGAIRPPRPARPLYPDRAPWWRWWAIGLAAAAALGLLWLVVRWWIRRSRRAAPRLGALAIAEREFAALDALGLQEAGESGRYLALLAEIVRSYLARRLPAAPLSSTTGELLSALHGDVRVPVDRLRDFLTESDLVKFARHAVSIEHMRAQATVARTLVSDIDAAVDAAETEARAEAARQAAREFEERRAARAAGTRGQAA